MWGGSMEMVLLHRGGAHFKVYIMAVVDTMGGDRQCLTAETVRAFADDKLYPGKCTEINIVPTEGIPHTTTTMSGIVRARAPSSSSSKLHCSFEANNLYVVPHFR